VRALDKLMVFHASSGNFESAIACGERILEREDTREITHRGMMRLYWLLGDRDAAVAQYERCETILKQTLGIKPMPATRRLYNRMLKNRYRPIRFGVDDWGDQSRQSLDQVNPTHIERAIGRLHQLEAELEQTKAELRQIERLIDQALTDGAAS
jgi:DNA-binding SARP family transcriptional activator